MSRGRRWLTAAGILLVTLAAGFVARPGLDPGGDGAITVEEATADASDTPRPREATPTPATSAPSPSPAPHVRDAPGEWVELDGAPIRPPLDHVGVWTGAELLVGFQPEVAAYDPVAGTWRDVPAVPGPDRTAPRVVWTGAQVLVVGGWTGEAANSAADGWLLDLDTQEWREIPPAPEAPLWDPTAVWTGEELILWGGARPGDAHGLGEWPVRGSAYRPDQDRWRVISEAPVDDVYFSDGLWTGREVVVWGSHHPPGQQLISEAGLAFAAAYDPATDTWRVLPAPPLENPAAAAAVWTGSQIVLWGQPPAPPRDQAQVAGAALDPSRPGLGWRSLPRGGAEEGEPAPVDGVAATATWTGQAAILFGGSSHSHGLIYDPSGESWQRLPAHRAAVGALAVWTGAELLLWGGHTSTGPDADLWAFRPPGGQSAACPRRRGPVRLGRRPACG